MEGSGQGDGGSSTAGRPPPAQQRRYNRRAPAQDVTPPYYEVFARIATALEGIERALHDREAGDGPPAAAPREQGGPERRPRS